VCRKRHNRKSRCYYHGSGEGSDETVCIFQFTSPSAGWFAPIAWTGACSDFKGSATFAQRES
jgi:hypothetical protein